MRVASRFEDSQVPEAGHDDEVRQTYRRYAGMRTRVLENAPAFLPTFQRRRGRPRLVLLHGYCDSADTWHEVLAELAARGRPAVAVDLPGFGHADALRAGAILPQLDAFVAGVLAEQAVAATVVLAGNSLGGTLSVRAGQRAHDAPSGVVSIAAPGLDDSWLVRTIGRYPLPLRLYANLPFALPGVAVRAVAQHTVPKLLYAYPESAQTAHVRRFTDLFADYQATIRRLAQARQLLDELSTAYQPEKIRSPMLVVSCGKDRLVRPAAGNRLHALVAHSRLLVRDDWGHCPQLDDPAALAEVLGYFAASATHSRDEPSADTSGKHAKSA